MAVIVRGYQYYDLKNPVEAWSPGAAAFLGGQTLSDWGLPSTGIGIGMRTAYSIGLSNITLSGGTTLYNMSVPQSLPVVDNVRTDTESQSISTLIYNPVFIGKITEGGSIALCMYVKPDNNPTPQTCFYLAAKKYEQTPDGAEQSARITWTYSNYAGSDPEYQRTGIENPDFSQYPLIKMYRTTIEEKEFYIIAVGVNAANQPVISSGMYLGTVFYAIPCVWFEDRIPVPYVGPVSKESVEASFMPAAEKSDSIYSRTGYDDNPYGVNLGSGIKLIFPAQQPDDSILPKNMQDIINGIYRGRAEGFLNQASQTIAQVIGGNSNRPADEISAILNGILTTHSIPDIYDRSSGGHGYASASTSFRSIAGYEITDQDLTVTTPGSKTIFREYYSSPRGIDPCLNCFLDYEPYTSMILKLPFFPPLSLEPSAVYGNAIQCTYTIDILTGLLSVDVAIVESGKSYIISTMQQNVKTSIPIMGQGAQAGALEKITSGVMSTMGSLCSGSTNLSGYMGMLGAIDTVSKSSTGVAVGKYSTDGLGAYLSPRSAYLIITHPEAAIPASEIDGAPVGNFLQEIGMAASLGGKVKDFKHPAGYAHGFASFYAADLSSVPCTEQEKQELSSLLREGVMI